MNTPKMARDNDLRITQADLQALKALADVLGEAEKTGRIRHDFCKRLIHKIEQQNSCTKGLEDFKECS